ncbi:hypothetical protein [Aeromicrobium sp. 50.2.37]|uniref:hypothetical protein n=1 Tax=Aeromicrobium sp. 50.2.37 TaxID=2969305 RepID=UPI00214FE529|nr:hypothetical protein [Aeromicrobium sp. 50.2.37]MCR4514840.1 hypothetical protein [Aeromicrobium sp. 50.2.37]
MSKPPKVKCCVSKTRCKRCPIRMLKEGTLPDGYGVKKRRLVRIGADGTVVPVEKKDKKSKKSKKGKKAQNKKNQGKKAKKHALAA